jgi:hypothetical protein
MLREQLILSWLQKTFPHQSASLSPVGADASFRRYFRVHLNNGEHYIVMDAPPQHEDCQPFVKIAKYLAKKGVKVPTVLHADLEQGLLVLTDFGDVTYLDALTPDSADELYMAAIDELIRIQKGDRPVSLPEYDRPLLIRELQLFEDWYLVRHLNVTPKPSELVSLNKLYAQLLDNIQTQTQVFVHRDYHSRNLMRADSCPGVLDFQDAVYGPITYDLVSLLRDAYIDWDETQVLDWVIRYWEKARRAGLPVRADFGEFYRDFEWMGLQRHLKVLGIFARLYYRDGKSGYLQDMPRVMGYVRKVSARYREFSPLLVLLDQWQGTQQETGLTF